jgi:lipopolysaccharide export system permease protein
MTLLNRHIFGEFFRTFLMILLGILAVYLCVDFLQRADSFIKYNATLLQIAKYSLYSLPAMATSSLPIAALIATLLSLGNLSRHNEIIAMRAGGVSIVAVIAPVLVGGIIISAFGFINNEYIMPVYTARANYIKSIQIEKKQQRVVFQQRKLWIRGPDNSIVNIELISPDRTEMIGVNIYLLNPDYTVRERIKAQRLQWENGAWRFRQSQKFILGHDTVISQSADNESFNIVGSPDDLGMIAKTSEEMNFRELWDYVKRLKMSGYKATRYEVDLYSKLALPLASLLMVMISTPLSVQQVRSSGASKGIALAVFIAFIYWGLMSVGTALGRSGALPPLESAWLANVFFAAASIIVLFRMQRSV